MFTFLSILVFCVVLYNTCLAIKLVNAMCLYERNILAYTLLVVSFLQVASLMAILYGHPNGIMTAQLIKYSAGCKFLMGFLFACMVSVSGFFMVWQYYEAKKLLKILPVECAVSRQIGEATSTLKISTRKGLRVVVNIMLSSAMFIVGLGFMYSWGVALSVRPWEEGAWTLG